MATSTTENFVPELNRVLNSTETVTLEATQALKRQGIEKEVVKFEKDVKRKIAETRARLNGLPANAVALAPGLVPAPGGPAPAPARVLGAPLSSRTLVVPGDPLPPAPGAPANSTVVPTTEVPIVNIPPIAPLSSPSDKLNLLKVLNESLINTIQQVIEQMGAGNTDSVRRMLGYIQILLIQLQKLVVVFNGLDNRMGRIENHFKIPRRLTNTSQPDLESLRKQLEELMKLPPPVPAPAPAPRRWFRNPFARTQKAGRRKTRAGKRKTRGMPRRRKKSSSKTRRRNTKNRR
jgi:hypothetical protein